MARTPPKRTYKILYHQKLDDRCVIARCQMRANDAAEAAEFMLRYVPTIDWVEAIECDQDRSKKRKRKSS